MTAIEINQAKMKVEALFQSAMEGEEVIITENEKPVLKLVRVTNAGEARAEPNALDKLRKIRISAAPDFSVKAGIYSTDEDK